ncbi:MAG: TIGR04283 family arsenosugar biosynthesis glycosyltransferase [Ginsengibacter sp.]
MESPPEISIIVPTFNEAKFIERLINYLKSCSRGKAQIIVSDGGSTDDTAAIALAAGATVANCRKKGRAVQMNFGATFAAANILYFVHADCLPPENFHNKILETVNKNFSLGRFQTKFDSSSRLLKINAFFTRFDWLICNGGDQTLFFKKEIFEKINGFNNDLQLMEDYDIVKRARQHYRYAIMKEKALVSARKYNHNSWIKVQQAHRKIMKMYRRGATQESLFEKYNQLLNYRY